MTQDLATEQYRDEVGSKPLKPTNLTRFTKESWSESLNKALNPEKLEIHAISQEDIKRAAKKADRWARDAERGQNINYAQWDKRIERWARIDNEPPTCTWCTVLISRGAVYLTKETAKFHTGCTCEAVLLFKDQVNPYQPLVDAAYEEYQNAVALAGTTSISEVTAAMKAIRAEAKG